MDILAKKWLQEEKTLTNSKKNYSHFDERTDLSKCADYVTNPINIIHHGFYPFIHYQLDFSRFSFIDKTIKHKTRDICYAAHIDRCIYQYYSFLLNNKYNKRLHDDDLNECVAAYRTDLHLNNIDFAYQAIDYIRNCNMETVVISDFTHFFDQLDHTYLKEKLCDLLNVSKLPDDYYKIYRSIVNYSYWERTDLLKINGLTEKDIKKFNKLPRAISKIDYKKYRSHIKKHQESYGIPQGSPISGCLANIYMLQVDKAIHDLVKLHEGFYLRYCDDFMLIFPDVSQNIDNTLNFVWNLISNTPGLQLEHSKTQVFEVHNNIIKNIGNQYFKDADLSKQQIQFLGFTFDGCDVRIRQKTISKYYSRMRHKAKGIVAQQRYHGSGGKLGCDKLYEKCSIRGAYTNHGNFLTYVNRAKQKFCDDPIEQDTKRHMGKIRKALK